MPKNDHGLLTPTLPFLAEKAGLPRSPAPFLPMSLAEMAALGWDACDVILVTGDAYIDHPSFGMALVGRLLEAMGFRVGIIAQPDWKSAEPFRALGRPRLFFGITAGNMDSMVNHYTSERRIRTDDAYTPHGEAGRRPDRAVTVYAQRAREAFPGVTVILGGIEASLRRIAHYDYWSDTVRRSVLPDSKADLLLFGNAERALMEVAFRLQAGEPVGAIRDVRGTAFMVKPDWLPSPDWAESASSLVDAIASPGVSALRQWPSASRAQTVIRLPAFEEVKADPLRYAHASRVFHLESNPGNARALRQRHGTRDVWLNPPPWPLSTEDMDFVYGLPYARRPHPAYEGARIPAWEMIRFSVTLMRGCFGGCTFCSITEHEGRRIQSRSEASVLREIETIRDKTPGFTGTISDIGGPTANMYRLACKDPAIEKACRRLSCVYPDICPQMSTDHGPLIALYRAARALSGIKKVLIGSGVRYDLAIHSPDYVRELAQHHTGGLLKIAPEHTEPGPLSKMMKPGIESYVRFRTLFERFSREVGKTQHLIPYFIAAHPGTSDEDMLALALWLKAEGFKPDQVQTFLPTPLALATTMYHTGLNPLKASYRQEAVDVVRSGRQRALHKAFLRWHDPKNADVLREALVRLGRADLIGSGPMALVPRGPRPFTPQAPKKPAQPLKGRPPFKGRPR
jgi:uncharacterized radical SAM protein YgiQ